jgi:hypothetical protein
LYLGTLFQAQVGVGFGHATDSPQRVLHLDFERGEATNTMPTRMGEQHLYRSQ